MFRKDAVKSVEIGVGQARSVLHYRGSYEDTKFQEVFKFKTPIFHSDGIGGAGIYTGYTDEDSEAPERHI